MVIHMAGDARWVQAKVGVFLFFDLRNCDEFLFMAGLAFLGSVCSLQFISCQVVVEGAFTEADDLEIPAMMVIMAYDTLL